MATPSIVRSALRSDKKAIEEFLDCASAVHRHLDWRSPFDWLGNRHFLIAEKRQKINSLLICTAEPNEVYWLRVFGSINFSSLKTNWQNLFQYYLTQINEQQPQPVIASIAYLNWMRELLDDSQWKIHQNVMQLKWKGVNLGKLAKDLPKELLIRPMRQSDLEVVSRIDRDCFKNIWLQSKDVIKRAYTQSSYTTVAEIENEVVGFQISSSHNSIAHLIRLAVSPKFQGQYIGQALVHHMLKHFQRPWIREITVNTQEDNMISLSLYDKMGFESTGENFPIYIYKK